MYDDDHDALAAEYVLGTLSAEERDRRRRCWRGTPGSLRLCGYGSTVSVSST